ncbi:MAG: hypothetical protein KatS3mg103_1242 [Phycisphaerales bacterium]|nr:MAG: hypothetical protein KatS3mg103_1242 [Phycisphaerales bacterium]
MSDPKPTVFHITHWKSGSQWVRGVLSRLEPDRVIVPKADMSDVADGQLRPGGIYTPVYMATQWFDSQVTRDGHQRFVVVIRDLRDAAVSWYFSVKHSHKPINLKSADDLMQDYRQRFNELDVERGLLLVVQERLAAFANIQQTWMRVPESDRLLVRYEDLIADEHAAFNRIFDYAGLEPDQAKRRAAIEAESFQARTGRNRGQEQIDAHHRKGVAGDWRNHFTRPVAEAFKEKFGQVLIETGYEKDLNW